MGAFSFVSELKGITMKGLDVADVGGQDLEHLMEDTKKFPKLLRGLKPKEVEENRKLQRGIVLNACHFAAEVLDVEGGGVSEAAAKLIARQTSFFKSRTVAYSVSHPTIYVVSP